MLYREAGQFKTATPPTWRFSPAQDRIGLAVIIAVAFASSRSLRQRLPAQRRTDSLSGLLARRDRAQPAHRLCGPDLARHRRLHGRRRLCLLQAHHGFPRGERHRLDPCLRILLGRRRRRCSGCPPCASRAFISWSRRWRRSSSCNGASPASPGSTTITSRARSRCRRARSSASPSPGAERDAADALSRAC